MANVGLALLVEEEPVFKPIIDEDLLSCFNAACSLDEDLLPRLHAQLGVVGLSLDVWEHFIGFVEFEAWQDVVRWPKVHDIIGTRGRTPTDQTVLLVCLHHLILTIKR